MKKLLILSVFAFFALVSANVFGQTNTGALPSIGSKHQYWVNGTFGTATSGASSTYTWWVSTSAGNLLTPVAIPSEFTPTSGYNVGAVGQNGIEIKWNPSSVGKTYYLVVQEVGEAPLCTNIKAYAIQPQNNFELVFAALDADGTTPGDNLSRCTPDIALTASGTTITYNYGSDNYLYKLTATGLYTDWSFVNAFANSLGNATQVTQYQIGGTSGLWTNIATPITVPANPAGTEVVYIRVALNNGTTAGTFEQGLVARTMKLTLSNVKDAGNNAVTKIYSSDGATDITGTPEQTQTVKARPSTTGISSN
jgi:hypothetical protein